MTRINRLLTLSCMISLLAAGIAGYAGTRAARVPVSLAIEELRDNCAVVRQGVGALSDTLLPPVMPEFYHGVIEYPYAIGVPPETLRLF